MSAFTAYDSRKHRYFAGVVCLLIAICLALHSLGFAAPPCGECADRRNKKCEGTDFPCSTECYDYKPDVGCGWPAQLF